MNDKKEVKIKIVNLDKFSHVDKGVSCDACVNSNTCTDMTKCPIITHVSRDVVRTTYCIDKSKLCINTGTFGHDFRRAIDVVNMAIDACTRQR